MTMEPKIVTKDEFNVVGMRYYGENKNNEISQLWDRFVPRIHEIKNPVTRDITFGVCYPVENQAENSEFEYIAAVEVHDFDEIAEGMVGRTVPTQKYAVFTHKGLVEKIGKKHKGQA